MISWIKSLISLNIFFTSWILKMIFPPLLLITIILALLNPRAALHKLSLLFQTTIPFLLFSKDKKWKQPKQDPAEALQIARLRPLPTGTTVETKTVYFLRHGESTWNDTFNKGDRSRALFLVLFLPNLIRAIAYEWYFFLTGRETESWFYDSPLSPKGIRQAEGLRAFLANANNTATETEREAIRVLLNNTPTTGGKSRMVSSNLRRAFATIAIALHDRIRASHPDDKIYIATDLQEASTNPDAQCITPSGAKEVLGSFADRGVADPSVDLSETCRASGDTLAGYFRGNKEMEGNGLVRIQAFCRELFAKGRKEGGGGFEDVETVICAGHSFWFRAFFRTYLPRGVDHVAKRKKIVNGGVVRFVMTRVAREGEEGEGMCVIDPDSVQVIYAGF